MKGVNLRFVNQSNTTGSSQIVMFQKNLALAYEDVLIAWRVLDKGLYGHVYSFFLPEIFEINTVDAWGNYTERKQANTGDLFGLVRLPSGDDLAYLGNATDPSEIQIRNDLDESVSEVNIFRDGLRLATKTGLSPGKMADFNISKRLHIGLIAEAHQGERLFPESFLGPVTELDLGNVKSADIVMKGGRVGQETLPVSFELENVVLADP